MYAKIFRSKNVYDIEKSINNLELDLLQKDNLLQFFSLFFLILKVLVLKREYSGKAFTALSMWLSTEYIVKRIIKLRIRIPSCEQTNQIFCRQNPLFHQQMFKYLALLSLIPSLSLSLSSSFRQ